MPTNSTRTRVDNQKNDHIDTKGFKQRNRPEQLQTHNLPTNDVEAQIMEEIYYSLTSRGLFPDEQKGCCKGSRGTAKLIYIDQHILDVSKTRWKNLAMAWIDNKKTYDIVPHSWTINSLKMYKISDEVINFIDKTMKTWRVELTEEGRR